MTGSLPARSPGRCAKLPEALEAAFAQEDKNSALSKVEQAVTAATEQVVGRRYAKMQRLVDPSAEESPMASGARDHPADRPGAGTTSPTT